ncbi:MAG TPA: hypothetical protein VEH06_17180 [Candidatus Bathyarchaeia archaeon]|nr:hypothetical protein [Candidatus Bathyarchaeia archaeon]
MSGDNGNNDNTNLVSEKEKNIQKMASAIEDLLYMEAIKVKDEQFDKAILSSKFAVIVSNLISSMKLNHDNGDDIMRLMYISLIIYMNECLKLPKALTMSFGNDLEKHRDEMECAELISNYVTVLRNIFSSTKKEIES